MSAQDVSEVGLRVPPHSIEAESSVLGALMLENNAWDRVGDILADADFYRYSHQLIFGAIATLMNAGKEADVVTVYAILQKRQQDEEAGGLDYLNDLAQYVPSASNIRRYAEIVRERSLCRRLVSAGEEIAVMGYANELSFEETLEKATSRLSGLYKVGGGDDWETPDAAMVSFLDGVQRRNDGDEDFLPTGLRALDERLNGGGRPGDLIVIAGRPGMGKTSLALSICENMAKDGATVGVLSMEMAKAKVHNRRVSMHSHIPLHKILRPERMSDFEWGQMSKAAEEIRALPVFVSDQGGLTINQVRTKARALKRRKGLRVLIVDYIGLMEGTDKKQNRTTQLGEVSRGMKALAKELGIVILLLAQLNREVEKRVNSHPIMADLRDCGDIEQDSDVILFVHRPIHTRPDLGPEWKYYAEIIVGKQRDGMTGTLHMQYVGDCVRFCDWPENTPKPTSQHRTKAPDL